MILRVLIVGILTWPLPVLAAQTPASPLPKVRVVATGGTIAGEQAQPGTLGPYRAGAKSVNDIVASVPEVARFADVETEQFSNVASPAIMPDHWLGLAKRINQLFQERPDLAGVVVTHGTDRLEETAFFLYLTIKSDKPVVVVGSQRPATGISPDGPINLLSAVRVAAAAPSRGMGVMVVMDDRILSAREARKIYPRSGGFSTGEMGMLGVVAGHGVEFFFAPVRKHGAQTDFDVTRIEKLPRVELTFSYPGGEGYRPAEGTMGLVLATTGMAPGERPHYDQLRRDGVILVTVFPSGDHVASPARGEGPPQPGGAPQPAAANNQPQRPPIPPAVVAQHMLPAKARILLMLALTLTQDPREIQRLYNEY